MLFPTTLFTKDPAIIQGLMDGSLRRAGGVIRETATGRIVRHLAETPGWTKHLINLPIHPITGGTSLVTEVVGQTVTIHKIGQVQQTLQITNQMLSQVMGLSQIAAGASVLNLGVSVAGFAYMGYKLHQLQKSMNAMQQVMETGFSRVENKLDYISGQLDYIKLIVEDNRQKQIQLARDIADFHKAFLVKEVSDLQAAIANRSRFPESSFNEDLKTANSARNFLSNQAIGINPSLDPRDILIADVAIQGWAIATTTEAYILLETGHILDARQILEVEISRFKSLASQWVEQLLNDGRPELATAQRFSAERFSGLIANERIERIASLSPFDKSLTEAQQQRKVDDVEVEFEMSYSSYINDDWINRQVAHAEYMDTLSELFYRIESMEAFASLCDQAGVKSSRELMPDDSYEPGLYTLNPSPE